VRYAARQAIGDDDSGIRHVYAVASPSTNRLVFRAEDLQRPPDLWVLDPERWEPRQLTHLNPALEQDLPGARLIEWRDNSGRLKRGALMLPVGYVPGRRYPMLVYQYPVFDLSSSIARFGGQDAGGLINLHLLTTRGYAVLLPDALGMKHGADPTLMGATWNAIKNGVARAIEIGIADSSRLGIMGHSFGSYGVVSTLVSTTRFRTGVALSGGYYNFPAQFAQMQPDGSSIYTKTSVYTMGCTLWECPARYVANSPLFFLHRVTASLLLVDGTEDSATQPAQSDQVFIGLQTLGRNVEYALYPGEDHDYSEWSCAHQVDVVKRVLRWLEVNLKGRR
ncbi:MAG: alpha/beta hydrolase family protein, partial [bacterium]